MKLPNSPMNQVLRFLVTIACGLLLVSGAKAQAPEEGKEKVDRAQLRFASVMPLKRELLFLVGQGMTEKLKITSRGLSARIEVKRGATYHLCSRAPEEATPEALKAVSLASFEIGASSFEAILLILGEGEESANVALIDASRDRFPWGSRLVINSYSSAVKFHVAGKSTVVKAKELKLLPIPKADLGDFILVKGFYNKQGRERKFLSSRWIHDLNSRSLIFVYQRGSSSAPVFHGIEDTRQPKEIEQ